ncbi:MAG: phosphodiesterase [Treponema sp.]|jgi:putative phosphoesterase|nr:phosphodiesterase [Treponema sp.]
MNDIYNNTKNTEDSTMKYMIISDIHGSLGFTERAIEQFKRIQADYLLILGDILYHGPRNPLPGGHNPPGVAALLNAHAGQIIAVRGNCDAEVDQMMLTFPCMSDYILLVDEGRRFLLTHGHLYDQHTLPFVLPEGSVLLSGHTHIWLLEHTRGITLCNPGSISLPKESPGGKVRGIPVTPTFAVYEKHTLSIYSFDAPEQSLKTINLG